MIDLIYQFEMNGDEVDRTEQSSETQASRVNESTLLPNRQLHRSAWAEGHPKFPKDKLTPQLVRACPPKTAIRHSAAALCVSSATQKNVDARVRTPHQTSPRRHKQLIIGAATAC